MGMVLCSAKRIIDSDSPWCSVCIANYNGEKLLEACIESILAQKDCPGNIEIIVHDDASNDNSIALLYEKYPQVRLLASKKNVGFCISNNRMVSIARGEYILLLNNDATLATDALTTLFQYSIKQKPQGILTLPQYDLESGVLVDRGCLLDPFYNPVPNLDPSRQNVAMVIGACLWMPRRLWLELEGFPEWMESIAEDLYLCCHARLKGYPVHVTAESGYYHWQGKSFGGNRARQGRLVSTYRRRALSERNKTYAMILFTPSMFTWILLTFHLMLLCTEGFIFSLKRRNFRIWRDIYLNVVQSVLQNANFLSRQRREIQNSRRSSMKSYIDTFIILPRKIEMLIRYGMPHVG